MKSVMSNFFISSPIGVYNDICVGNWLTVIEKVEFHTPLIGIFIALLLASLSPEPLLPAELVAVGEDSVRGVVDGVFILLPNKEGWLVDELIADLDLPVGDQSTGVVDALGLGGLVDLGLETALEKVAWGE